MTSDDKWENDPYARFEASVRQRIRAIREAADSARTPSPLQSDLLHAVAQYTLRLDNWDAPEYAPYVTASSGEAPTVFDFDGWDPDGLTEARRYGGWDPDTDAYVHVTEDGDLEGLTRTQANMLEWRHRGIILDAFARAVLRGHPGTGEDILLDLTASLFRRSTTERTDA